MSNDRGGGAGMVVSDQDIAEALDSLFRDNNPENPTFTSLNGIVQHLESKLGLDLSHKIDFIRSRIQLLFQPQPQPPLQLQKDHFALHQNSNFLPVPASHPRFQSPTYAIPHPHDYRFRPPPPQQQQQPPPQVVSNPPATSPAAAPETPKERCFFAFFLLFFFPLFLF